MKRRYRVVVDLEFHGVAKLANVIDFVERGLQGSNMTLVGTVSGLDVVVVEARRLAPPRLEPPEPDPESGQE